MASRARLISDVAFSHTALGRGLIGLARCGLLAETEATAQDLLDYLRTPGLLERIEVIDALELEIRQQGLTTAAQARERLGFELAEIEGLRDARHPAAELARHARRLQAAPHRREAAVLSDAERQDALALKVLLRAVAELDELGRRRGRVSWSSCSSSFEVRDAQGGRRGAITITEPLAIRARRFHAVLVCGLQEGEFPRPGSPEPFLSDERRRELATASGLRLPPERGRAGPRALPLLFRRLPSHGPGRPQLPQLRRGGQPGSCPRRSSTTWPTCSTRAGRSAGAAACSATSYGRPPRLPPSVSSSARWPPPPRPATGRGRASRAQTCRRRRWPTCATAESFPAGALELYADLPREVARRA